MRRLKLKLQMTAKKKNSRKREIRESRPSVKVHRVTSLGSREELGRKTSAVPTKGANQGEVSGRFRPSL